MFQKTVSINIGDSNIFIVVGRSTKNKVAINKYYTFPTPKDAVKNGEILKTEELTQLLKAKVLEYKLVECKTTVVFQSTFSVHRESVLPYVKNNDLGTMVQYELEQYLPMVLNDYVIQFKVLEYFTDDTGDKQRVLVSAIPIRIVEGYYKLIKEAGLVPSILDTSSNAISKLFSTGQPFKGYDLKTMTVAVVGFGHGITSADILKNCITSFIRKIPTAGNTLTNGLTELLGVSYEEAEMYKHENSSFMEAGSSDSTFKRDREKYDKNKAFLDELRDDAKVSYVNTDATLYIRNFMMELCQEIQNNFNFFVSRNKVNIDYIIIYGGGSNIPGIEEFMTDFFKIPVTRISKLYNVKVNKNYKDNSFSALSAIGAIIRK